MIKCSLTRESIKTAGDALQRLILYYIWGHSDQNLQFIFWKKNQSDSLLNKKKQHFCTIGLTALLQKGQELAVCETSLQCQLVNTWFSPFCNLLSLLNVNYDTSDMNFTIKAYNYSEKHHCLSTEM